MPPKNTIPEDLSYEEDFRDAIEDGSEEDTDFDEDDEYDEFAEDGPNGASGEAREAPLVGTAEDLTGKSMTREEAKASVRCVKFHIARKKNHEGELRRGLMQQYERRAWEVLGFSSFEAFAEKMYSYKKAYAYQLVNASQTERALQQSAIADYKPLREYPLRLLGCVEENHREEVYLKARKCADRDYPTGRHITEAARSLGYASAKKDATGIGSKSNTTTNLMEDSANAQGCTRTNEIIPKSSKGARARAHCNLQTGNISLRVNFAHSDFGIDLTSDDLRTLGYERRESGVKK